MASTSKQLAPAHSCFGLASTGAFNSCLCGLNKNGSQQLEIGAGLPPILWEMTWERLMISRFGKRKGATRGSRLSSVPKNRKEWWASWRDSQPSSALEKCISLCSRNRRFSPLWNGRVWVWEARAPSRLFLWSQNSLCSSLHRSSFVGTSSN